MAPLINMNELYQLKKKKEQIKNVSFDRIIEMCHKRIKNIAAHGGMNTFYEIPGMLLGYPLYNIYECLDYVVDKLRKNGFLVQVLPPPHVCVVYVSWDPEELKPKKNQPLAIAPATSSTVSNKETQLPKNDLYIPRFVTKTEYPETRKFKL
jgi:hypothetical protein